MMDDAAFLNSIGIEGAKIVRQVSQREDARRDVIREVQARGFDLHDRVVVIWTGRTFTPNVFQVFPPTQRSYRGSVARVTRQGYHVAVDGCRAKSRVMRVTFREIRKGVANIERERRERV